MRQVAALLTSGLLAGCSALTPTPEELVLSVAEGIVIADNARDVDAVMTFYEDDAVLLPPSEPPVHGKEAIRPRYEKLFLDFQPKIAAGVEEVVVDGDQAVVLGTTRGWFESRRGEELHKLHDSYVMVVRRGADGQWRIARLMWHGTGRAEGDSGEAAGR